MQLQVAKVYCEQLPEITKGISEAYAKIGNITMYGDQSGAIASAARRCAAPATGRRESGRHHRRR